MKLEAAWGCACSSARPLLSSPPPVPRCWQKWSRCSRRSTCPGAASPKQRPAASAACGCRRCLPVSCSSSPGEFPVRRIPYLRAAETPTIRARTSHPATADVSILLSYAAAPSGLKSARGCSRVRSAAVCAREHRAAAARLARGVHTLALIVDRTRPLCVAAGPEEGGPRYTGTEAGDRDLTRMSDCCACADRGLGFAFGGPPPVVRLLACLLLGLWSRILRWSSPPATPTTWSAGRGPDRPQVKRLTPGATAAVPRG